MKGDARPHEWRVEVGTSTEFAPIPSENLGLRVDLSLCDTDNRCMGVGVHPKPPYWADDSYEGP
jgi:hypothetical protein